MSREGSDKQSTTNTDMPEETGTKVAGDEPELNSTALLAERELLELRMRVKKFCQDFDAINWGWDGDCGSERLKEDLEETVQDQFGNWIC